MPFPTFLVTATDLVSWSDRRNAQAELPRLIRRLIFATSPRLSRLTFPSGEGVQQGGWDGIAVSEQGNSHLPVGQSVWEVSTQRSSKAKADQDYSKRSEDPRGVDPGKTVFVFATTRRWPGKEAWAQERTAEGIWREVRAYDADDLEAWLEQAPATHLWISSLTGKFVEGSRDLASYWLDWSEATRPPLPRDLVIAGREKALNSLLEWLGRDDGSPLAVRAESAAEVVAAVASFLEGLANEDGTLWLSRAIVVDDPAPWTHLAAFEGPLLLIPLFNCTDVLPRAIRSGHRVLVPLGVADPSTDETLELPRPSRDEVTAALTSAGFDQERARALASLARRSLIAFRRSLAVSRELQQPEWATPDEARRLIPAMLAGQWQDDHDADTSVLNELAGGRYEQLAELLSDRANRPDPPFRRVGTAWVPVSREDHWSLLARYVTATDLQRFEQAALDVLREPDPKYELPANERWMSAAHGRAPAHTSLLSEGLAGTLALLGTRPRPVDGMTTERLAARIVFKLFENADWKIWATVSSVMPVLAEAAPSAFLDAVEQVDDQLLEHLFPEGGEDPLSSTSPHTGLLWALEVLAWSSEHLTRTALVLARLERIGPERPLGNRPHESLCRIFLSWCPHTFSTLDERLDAIDRIRIQEPAVAWQLLLDLLPKHSDAVTSTATPRWKAWGDPHEQSVSRDECNRAVAEITQRVLAEVGAPGRPWSELLDRLDELPAADHDSVVGRLEESDEADHDNESRGSIWHSLRRIVSRHRSYSHTTWALPRDRVDRLAGLLDRFEPLDLSDRYGWLFTGLPELPEGRENDLEQHDALVSAARRQAVGAVVAARGLEGLEALAQAADVPWEVGSTLGQSELPEPEEILLHLDGAEPSYEQLARGFCHGRIRKEGREWGERTLERITQPKRCANLLLCLPCDQRTWSLAADDPEVHQHYWLHVRPVVGNDDASTEHAARELLSIGRPHVAMHCLARARGSVSDLLVAEVLEAVDGDPPPGELSPAGAGLLIAQLLDALAQSQEVDEARTARLEWKFLPILERRRHVPTLLHRHLSAHPELFAQLVCAAFRPEDAEAEDDDDVDQVLADNAYRLLKTWRNLPGSDEAGAIDEAALVAWVLGARAALVEARRITSGDEMIGRMLSSEPAGDDGVWPHEAVRNVLEAVQSRDLERGLQAGRFNTRGVYTRQPGAGGDQEHEISDSYQRDAKALQAKWPRVSVVLTSLAETYSSFARRWDEDAEL